MAYRETDGVSIRYRKAVSVISGVFTVWEDGKKFKIDKVTDIRPAHAMDQIVDKAVMFATMMHSGTVRKGTQIPYIMHPMEAAAIVSSMTEDKEVIAAALLHDVLEDTGCSYEQLEAQFGGRIASLVAQESENKREDQPAENTWRIGKEETLKHMARLKREAKMIALGDKLANIRAIKRDYDDLGNKLWDRFNQKILNNMPGIIMKLQKNLAEIKC